MCGSFELFGWLGIIIILLYPYVLSHIYRFVILKYFFLQLLLLVHVLCIMQCTYLYCKPQNNPNAKVYKGLHICC